MTCINGAKSAENASEATADGHYNDCINPTSTDPNSLGGCDSQAVQMCGTDNTCLINQLAVCKETYLGDGTPDNVGVCKNSQNSAYSAAGTTYDNTVQACYNTYTNYLNDVCAPLNQASPIVIDPTGEGFWLTDKQHGVQFRKNQNSPLQQMSWTDPEHHNAWLVKPNADGSVTSLALNMFGNLSPQPPSDEPNGYLALAYWAAQEGCGQISRLDSSTCPAVWTQLRLWQDSNQDGVAQPKELHTLEALGVLGISLEYHESQRIDQYGNQFRYAAPIYDAAGEENERCYDVFLVM
jgi:hypothetical protein